MRSQCNQIPMDKMKHDPDWDTASTRYDPLKEKGNSAKDNSDGEDDLFAYVII